MRVCPKCGHKNDDVNFCSSCGHDLRTQPEPSVFCPYCGAPQNSTNNVFCCKCGKRMKDRKKGKYIWIFLALAIVVLMCCLMVFRQNGDDVPQETTCQHEWQNNGVTSICTKCRGVIITPSDSDTSSQSANQNIVTENAEESEQEMSVDEKVVQPAETAPKHPIAVDGGEKHSVILYSDGTVTTIGNDTYAQRSTSGWRDIIQISTFSNHTLGLKEDGTVVAAGSNYQGQCDVSAWKDIICVAAGTQHSVGLKRDGTVVAVGANGSGQCDVQNWRGIKYVSANGTSTFALTEDGQVLTCGSFQNRNLDNWQDIVSFSVSANHIVGVHSNGTVSAVGANDRGQRDGLEGKQDVSQVAVGYGYTAGLKTNGKVWVNGCDEHNEHAAMQWTDIVAIGTGTEHILGIKKDGTLVAKGTNDDGQCDVYALNQMLKISEEAGESNSAEATESLISFLMNYEREYGELFDDYFTYDGEPSFSPAILEDVDADGEKELILHTFPCVEYEEDSLYGSQVEQYAVYGYNGGEWALEKAPQVVGSLSYAGFSGHAGVLHKDGKPILYTHEWKAPYGTSEGPGVEFTYLITVYDSKYTVAESFAVIKSWEGDIDEWPYKEIVEYEINGMQVSYEKFIETISKYDGIHWDEVNCFDFDTDAVTVDTLLDQIR